MKKKVFRIYYSYDGQGSVAIEAKTQKEAQQLFNDGHWSDMDAVDGGTDNYQIIEISEVE